jgi:class 3 adenylate cyclase
LPEPEIRGIGTVMVTDIGGVTISQNGMSSDELARLFNEAVPSVHETIERYSGLVVRSIGDAALAAWGQQPPSVNHARLAFDAARSILRCRSGVTPTASLSFGIRIALGTGDLRVGVVGMGTQAYGRAAVVANKLTEMMRGKRDALFLSGETLAMLDEPPSRFRLVESGPEKGLGTTKVFEYLPAANIEGGKPA